MILLCFIIFCFIGSDPASGSSCSCFKDLVRCGFNMTFTSCPDPCPLTCESPERTGVCTKECLKEGCQCKDGFFLNSDGKCVKLQDCPNSRCGPNMIFTSCPNPCPPTCDFPGGAGVCSKMCLKEGCQCKDGFYLTDDGQCVQLQDCPGARNCSSNESFVFCNVGCPSNDCPTFDTTAIVACSPPFPCKSGCSCNANFLRPSSGADRCISASDCPPIPCRGPNMVFSGCPPPCFIERCSDLTSPSQCDSRFFNCRPRCVCQPGFLLNDSDVCVPESQCFRCGYNEMSVKCRTICPPQSCDIAYTEYACGILKPTCEFGCDCLPGFLRNTSGICIPNQECQFFPVLPPICGDNEAPTDCKSTCPPKICKSLFTKFNCSGNTCESGCDCIDGFLRNSDGVCVQGSQCFTSPNGSSIECGINEKPSDCRVICPPQTCDSIFTTFNCTGNDVCETGCDCLDGFLRNDSGICVRSEKCFDAPAPACGLNEKPSDCRIICPPQTCDSIFSSFDCTGINDVCESGCDCLDGSLRNESGICIQNEQCFGGPSLECGINEKTSDCRVICPPQTCDSIFTLFNCTGKYFCEPGCDCLPEFLRNDEGICVRSDQCFLEPKCDIPPQCRPTCAVPNPRGCRFIPPSETNQDGCRCQQGFVLSDVNGPCVEIEQCPTNLGCNGDRNAVIKREPLPRPCQSTCQSPNAFPCRLRRRPVGCECQPGFILNKFGRCIKPDRCKGGNPCGANGTFVPCRSLCQNNFCPENDDRIFPVCETFPFPPCFSGCICKLNNRFRSRNDQRCIRSDTCPSIPCNSRPFEIFVSCPSDCSSGFCGEVDQLPVPCNTLVLNCNPQCTCMEGFFRDPSTDICVSAEECRIINAQNQLIKEPWG